jgi:predicted transcriptional regulator
MDVDNNNGKWPPEFVVMIDALAHKIRRSIFSLLLEHPSLSFNQIMNTLTIERASLAYHLGILRKAKLINNFYDKREGVKDHSFYEVSTFGKEIYQELFKKVKLGLKLEQYNTINFRNVTTYTIEPKPKAKTVVDEQSEVKPLEKVLIVNGNKTSKISEWQTQILKPEEYKKLYRVNFLKQEE